MTKEQHKQTNASSNQRSPSKVPDIIWAPLTSAALILIVGLLGWVAHQPWLFPSLGPTVFLQAEQPQ
ncbi:MAG: hypothetical protein RMX68_014275 [Aulosira sp. ZfuVER01]|nr:hypothetical protein [Aulosira sp. ZfuVER01]MDZ8000253.1 hypothetical protein [Aulosira sp. DedVER01a]MDZ8053379.1 hypothetical protein [Aulosira sp. ZfuCHP01]